MKIFEGIKERSRDWIRENWLSAMTIGCVFFWTCMLFLLLSIPVQ